MGNTYLRVSADFQGLPAGVARGDFTPRAPQNGTVAVGTALRTAPRADPSERNYRTGLLPRVRASNRTLGHGCLIRAWGSHRVARRSMRFQFRRCAGCDAAAPATSAWPPGCGML